MAKPAWKRVGSEWRDAVLVCRKCSKRLGGGFGPDRDEQLAKTLRRAYDKQAGGRKARRHALTVVEVGCFNVCPRGAVVIARGREPGAWQLAPAGAALPDIAERLGLPSLERE